MKYHISYIPIFLDMKTVVILQIIGKHLVF